MIAPNTIVRDDLPFDITSYDINLYCFLFIRAAPVRHYSERGDGRLQPLLEDAPSGPALRLRGARVWRRPRPPVAHSRHRRRRDDVRSDRQRLAEHAQYPTGTW